MPPQYWLYGLAPLNHLYTVARVSCWPPEDGSICDPKHVGVNFTRTFNVFLINIELWVHELVIIETGHINARFKHEVWIYLFYSMKLLAVFMVEWLINEAFQSVCGRKFLQLSLGVRPTFRCKTNRAMEEWRNIEARSCNHCCSGKAVRITYSELLFVALGIQHAMLMRHIVICGLPRSTIFSTLSHKRHVFEKKLLNPKCVFWFSLQLLSEIFLILRRI